MPEGHSQVTVGLINGEVLSFFMPSEESLREKLTAEAQESLFKPTHLMFGNSISLVALPTQSIAWIRIHDSIDLPWKFPFGADLIEYISEEAFEETANLKRITTKMTITHEPVGTAIQIFLRMHCGDGSIQHFRASTHTLSKDNRLSLPELYNHLAVYFAKHPDGGWVILNTKTLQHWESLPGPVDLPETVWPMLRVEGE
jgi:hypothetical protein